MGRRDLLQARTGAGLILRIEGEVVCPDCGSPFVTSVFLALTAGDENRGGKLIAAEAAEIRCASCREARP